MMFLSVGQTLPLSSEDRLLRARRERPRRRRSAEQRDELAALYPDYVKPRACAVKVCLMRSLAALRFSPDCQTPGARDEAPLPHRRGNG